MTAPTPDLKFLARNIINQIGDLWYDQIPSEKWVPVRQATNDQLDVWVTGLLEDALAAVTAERDQARQMLADAPHEFPCMADLPQAPTSYVCRCWKAGL